MRKLVLTFIFSSSMAQNPDYLTVFERGDGNQTATYDETVSYFKKLDADFQTVSMREMGATDSGEPLHIVIFNPDKIFDSEKIGTKAVLLVNNGIHPGEPDGIDATMMLFRDLATGKVKAPKNTVVVNIPVYNIGGMLNRNSHSRANQNGPSAYGFRGNARNFDLNRDFVKSDSRNARSFAGIFHLVNPDVFIDNHVSNGADYQYTFTYIATHFQKLGGVLGDFWDREMLPAILAGLKGQRIESVPYVNIHDEKPDAGFENFMDSPRYSTGYAAMFSTLGSMPETHMLKPYADRVRVTYAYMLSTLEYVDANHQKIKKLRRENAGSVKPGSKYPLLWEIDSAKVSEIPFLGYEGGYKPSGISGQDRLFYDRQRPFNKMIPYYKHYKPALEIAVPDAYVVPKAWWPVVDLLKLNGIELAPLDSDREIEVESYRITGFDTYKTAYEGHYPHFNVSVEKTKRTIALRKGDFIVKTDQPGVKYILETLEPQGVDSFFAWNFFDSILQQKEYFSAYVFEDLAAELLEKDKDLKARFESAEKSDATLAALGAAQLDWVYRHSPYYEKSHMEYPVYRVVK
jgi:hypothetical protein